MFVDWIAGIQRTFKNAITGLKKSKAAAAAVDKGPRLTIPEVKNKTELSEALKKANSSPVIVECFAAWCPPCHEVAPIFERYAAQYNQKITALKMNVDIAQDVTDEYALLAIPAFLVFKNEVLVEKMMGKTEQSIAALFSKYNDQ